ncbi:zf-C2H2 Zinc finger, C2H2 type [Linnemannia gamsii]|uniref:Zf-C2H2 Zinc finger, C2H2 type n=1 Tax=Linnemannia gamsii TaxID=64522 RepID=A0ABQ7JWC9_9FUNG|nr:zf-C2H2 Zinc finger, C2H2 type [Linnemannia gamsii]
MVAFPPVPTSLPNTLNASGLMATPLTHRSLSAPSHLQLSALDQDTFVSGQLMASKNYTHQNDSIMQQRQQQQYLQHQHQQQQLLQQHLDAQFPAEPTQQVYDQQQYLLQPQLHMGMQPQPPPQPPQQQQQQHPMVSDSNNYTYQQAVHPFQMDLLHASLNQVELSPPVRVKFEFPGDSMPRHGGGAHQAFSSQDMDDERFQVSTGSLTYSPSSSSMDSSSPTFSGTAAVPPTSGGHPSAVRSTGRVFSMPCEDLAFGQFELPEEFAGYAFPRHGSLGSLYPITQSHELLDSTSPFGSAAHHHYHFHGHRRYETGGAEMVPSTSSTSISSVSSLPPSSGLRNGIVPSVGAVGAKTIKQRRASLSPDTPTRVFNCMIDDCGKLFKRSEHLKRHVRSVHSLEKPFICAYCPKCFSRSDNLNQHIRVHRHDKEKAAAAAAAAAAPKPFTNFTPFLRPTEKAADRF